ncbi:flagellar hook-basal body complex protein FliE [Pseudoduganella namucuonensis]|uniref:Flagellar hook-basal body complex protein FliE n=1 Tax=Pseudoduganella namucuonensis TaxID=1035707 RepID=A0A1I7M464_9BURK|nr:flagellar hook-basal body complex protein FliE [Pseudoduganella namucuonensis]SFV16657.1 flagellar hook-basal body complex protein FliE [Pseudoduganella namucuonensis]
MTVEAIGAVAAVAAPQAAPVAAVAPPDGSFGNWFAGELNAVNATLVRADEGVRQLAAGEATSLHEVMIQLEEAKMSFQLLAQVRNRLLEAYQDVMRTQV